MEEEVSRYRCVGDDGASLTVIEYRHVQRGRTALGERRYPGAARLALSTGEPVRYIDAVTFEMVETGELLRREEQCP